MEVQGDDLVVDVLSTGERGLVTLLDAAIDIIVTDFAKQSQTCKEAIIAQIFSSEFYLANQPALLQFRLKH